MNVKRTDGQRSLSMVFKRQSQLYDLHTHLLGMGSASFWVDTILMNEDIMPTDTTFHDDETKRRDFCPLVWDQTANSGFVNGQEAARFFNYLTKEIILPDKDSQFENAIGHMKHKKFSPVLENLIKEDFYDELLDRTLTFRKDFSYDVVLTLSDLGKGLGIKETNCEDIIQLAVTEKLGIYPPNSINFREWIIFNARKQEFQIVYGIQVQELRKLIECDPNAPSKAKELARAYIINAFSMCDAEGTPARHVDLHNFHGSFTPDFYPRRFALKDSIYSQRLDILAMLIAHIIERYQTCLPPVKYCEFSVSTNDLSKPWVFDVLRGVRVYDKTATIYSQMNDEDHTYIPTKELSSFSQLVLKEHFPHLEYAFSGSMSDNGEMVPPTVPQVTYKFLAGFDRRKVKSSYFKDANEAVRFLLEYPQQAILLMLQEIIRSKKEAEIETATTMNPTEQFGVYTNEENIFSEILLQLNELKSQGSKMPSFYDWVVGLDLFGDELGYPYCPFVARPFIEYIQDRRKEAEKMGTKNIFGVRIHGGENVMYADDNTPAYRLFIAHMYIVFRCLRFLQQELQYGIRIGHGIAFDRILGDSMSTSRHRKSSVLLAEMREHAKHLMKTIALEVNITSNEYLLGQTLRQGDDRQPLRLDGLFGKTHIILATDDDGIWPIDKCALTHPGHQSLAAEYCRAISSGLIKNVDQLKSILEDTKNFCFWNRKINLPILSREDALPIDDTLINTVIIHPDIVRRLYELHQDKSISMNPSFNRYMANTQNITPVEWTNEYGALRVAFICICANHQKSDKNDEIEEKIRKDYYELFGENKLEFDSIYNFWRAVRSELIFFKPEKEMSQTSKVGHYVTLKQTDKKNILVYCTPHNDNLTQSQDESLTAFIHQFRLFKYTIHAYGNEINIRNTVEVLEKQVQNDNHDEAYKDMILNLYTNKNRYTYVRPKLGKDFNLIVNPHSSKRNKEEQSFLYVLCQCASAATAALNLICKRILPSPAGNDSDVGFGVLVTEIPKHHQTTTKIPRQSGVEDSVDTSIIPSDQKCVKGHSTSHTTKKMKKH